MCGTSRFSVIGLLFFDESLIFDGIFRLLTVEKTIKLLKLLETNSLIENKRFEFVTLLISLYYILLVIVIYATLYYFWY